MCLSKFSNLELLRQVAVRLHLFEDHGGNTNKIFERELAGLIHSFYQGEEGDDSANGKKRKTEVEETGNKKLRIYNKVLNTLTALELLPNEVFEKIIKCLGGEDKKNLRITSKGLYHKTTLMAPIFHNWCFEANKGTQPDFILNNDKSFYVSELRNSSCVDPASNIIYRYTHRISAIKIDLKGELLKYLRRKPSDFHLLTSLDLNSVDFKTSSLLVLAPQLVHLTLCYIKNPEFDISSVDEDSKCFTKLKTLKLFDGKINVIKILTKCSNTLEYMELSNHDRISETYYLEKFNQNLPSLKYLSFLLNSNDFFKLARFLLSKCRRSLRTLILNVFSEVEMDLSSLLDQTINITTLDVRPFQNNLGSLLNKCPSVQNLTIHNYNKEVEDFCLKDLMNLKLLWCGPRCASSVLKQVFKYPLKTLHLVSTSLECDFPVIPELDVVRIKFFADFLEFNQTLKLFPLEAKLSIEKQDEKNDIVIRRVYDLL